MKITTKTGAAAHGSKSVSKSIRVPAELMNRIEAIAKKYDVRIHALLLFLIETGLENQDEKTDT
tara:strand:+ start:7664 stop:7855 length:192 start_codon:yes stop_codon:yes gene_type:complete